MKILTFLAIVVGAFMFLCGGVAVMSQAWGLGILLGIVPGILLIFWGVTYSTSNRRGPDA